MTEEKKYYTPDIFEFHVGFEYEEFVKGEGWMPRTLSSLSEDPTLNQQGFCIDFPYDFRVKCLDKEDIEAEGWKMVKTASNCFLCFKNKNNYSLMKIEDSNFIIQTFELTKHEPELPINHTTLFQGQILNRSELKFQMKRLGIV